MVPAVSSWRPQVVENLAGGSLCPDFIAHFNQADGTPAAMVPVFLQLATGGVVPQGLTDLAGNIRVIGGHTWDSVGSSSSTDAILADLHGRSVRTSSTRVGAPCPPSAAALPLATPVIARP
jgi:hypothetical protein